MIRKPNKTGFLIFSLDLVKLIPYNIIKKNMYEEISNEKKSFT